MSHYVNGIFEMSGNVEYSKMNSGQTSIGVRLNQRSWFKGAIRSLRVTRRVLEPEDFMINITNLDSDELSNVKEVRKSEFILYQNYPNPFNPETTIHIDMPVSGYVELTIIDSLGRKVSTLLNHYVSAGSHRIKWSTNDNGEKLAGGIYFAQIKSKTMRKNIKLIYLP
ncbi:MAG: T9SS type A sorting domain-containing protein [Calditrichaceae bacterium]